MRFDEGHESPDVIDRRGEPQQAGGGGGGWFFLISLLLRTRYGWIILLVGGAYYFWTRVGAVAPTDTSRSADGVHQGSGQQSREESTLVHFVSFVLDDAQAMWSRELPRTGKQYRNAKLVLFTDATRTACGYGDAATGPFYCPSDERVYIDLDFYRQLERRLGAGGDFAQAYVIAHEIGHHVQKIWAPATASGACSTAKAREALRCDSSCRPIVSRESGLARPRKGTCSKVATSTKPCAPPQRSATTSCSVRPRERSHPKSGRMARRSNAANGSDAGTRRGRFESCDTFSAQGL